MLVPSINAQLLDRLRAAVSRGTVSARAHAVLPFGIDGMDSRLAQGGIGSALHEVTAASSDLAEDAAATLFVAGIAGRLAIREGSVVWALSRFDLYAPGLEQAGLPAERMIFVEGRDDAEVLAVMEDALRFGSLAAVVGEARRIGMTATRRLQLAAAEGGTPALLLRRWKRLGTCPLVEASAATTRWRVGCAPSPARDVPGVNRQHWRVELVRQRNGDPFTIHVEASDAQGRLALPAAVADRAPAQASAIARAV